MIINFKATNIELNDQLRAYASNKLAMVEKALPARENKDDGLATVELGRTTQHHKHGDIFRAEINLNWSGQYFRSEAKSTDLYTTIDETKDKLVQEIKTWRKKQETVLRRGARAFKNWLRGEK